MKKLLKAVCVMAVVLGFAGGAYAGSYTQGMDVKADVQSPYTVGIISALDFGSFDNSSAGTVPATGQIIVKAPNGANYNVTIDAGMHYSGTRQVNFAGEYMAYNIYQDASNTIEWGDSGFGDTYTAGSALAGTGTGADEPYTVYGVLTKNTNAPSGLYADVVNVTVNW